MAIDYSMVLNQRPFSQRLSEGLTGFANIRGFEEGIQQRKDAAAAAAQRAAVLGQLPGIIDNPQAISELVLRNPAAAGDVEALLKSRQGILDNASQEAYSAALGPAMQAFDQGDKAPLNELMVKFPKQREDALKQMGLANKEQAEATGLLGLQLKTAAERGDSGVVTSLLSTNGNILKRLGYDPAALAESYAKNPEDFIKRADGFAALSLGPAKYNEYNKVGAEAKKAGVEADYAERIIQNDMEVKRLNSRIYAMTAAAQREANDLKRQELGLQIKNLEDARDQKKREMSAAASDNLGKVNLGLDTIGKLEKFSDSDLDSVLGPVSSRLPTVSGTSADIEAIIDQLGSQSFLSAVAQAGSMAGLTEVEGAKLQTSAVQLSKSQSVPQFKKNLSDFKSLLNKTKENIRTKYGSYAQPEAGSGMTGDAEIDALLKKYGG